MLWIEKSFKQNQVEMFLTKLSMEEHWLFVLNLTGLDYLLLQMSGFKTITF